MKITAERITSNGEARVGAHLAGWLVHAPGQSPAWEHYAVNVVHLRRGEGLPEPRLRFPEATHEFIVCALDPGLGPRADAPETLQALHPLNHVEQFGGLTDEIAVQVCERLVDEFVRGWILIEPAVSTGGGADPSISRFTRMLIDRFTMVPARREEARN